MLSRAEKSILKHGEDNQEIRSVLSASSQPLSVADGIEVLRLLLGRGKFDYEMVDVLKQRGCDLNKPLGCNKDNPDGYTTADYLASYGRLSPRLISEMAKAGYDFKRLNNRGEHAGFYLVGGAPLNKEVVAALKAQGVDFSIENKEGKTVADIAVKGLVTYAQTTGMSERKVFKDWLGAFFEQRDDYVDLYYADKDKIVENLNRRFAEIEPNVNADKGILSVYEDYKISVARCQRVYTYCDKHNVKDYFMQKTDQKPDWNKEQGEFIRGKWPMAIETHSAKAVLQGQMVADRQRKK